MQKQRDGASALKLMRRRVVSLLRRGRVEEALSEARDPALLESARDDPDIAALLLRVACATAWSHPEESAYVFERAMEGASPGVRWEEDYEARVHARPRFEAWRDRYRNAHDLIRLLTVYEGLDADALEVERRRVASAAQQSPMLYLVAITSLTEDDPELSVLFFEALGWTEDEELDDSEGDLDAGMIRRALLAADKAIDKDFRSKLHTIYFLMVIVVIGVLVAKLGWWGLFGLGLFVPLFVYVIWPADERLYRDILRPQIAKTIVRAGCTVEDVLGELIAMERPTDNIGRFKREIREDAGMHYFVYLLRSDRT